MGESAEDSDMIGQNRMTGTLKGIWRNLPIFYSVYTILSSAVLSMAYFNPSRTVYLLSALLPLFWIFCYVLASQYAEVGSADRVGHVHLSLKRAVLAAGSMIVILIALALIVKPVTQNNIVVDIQVYYPSAIVSNDGGVTDGSGNSLYDKNGVGLAQNALLTTSDGREWRLEGTVLVDVAQKRALIGFYEIINVVWMLLFLAHCLQYRRLHGVIRFFGAALLYGFLLESGGVLSGFFTENDYHVYFPFLAAPMVTMLGWPMVFYCVVCIWEKLTARWKTLMKCNAALSGIAISLIALCWDLNVDPAATGLGLWTWNAALPAWFLGVPLVNFTSWFSAVFSFGAGYTLVMRSKWSEQKKTAAMFAVIPILLIVSAVINFLICGFAEGFDGPSWTVLTAYLHAIM